jgi:hypothetical protein
VACRLVIQYPWNPSVNIVSSNIKTKCLLSFIVLAGFCNVMGPVDACVLVLRRSCVINSLVSSLIRMFKCH